LPARVLFTALVFGDSVNIGFFLTDILYVLRTSIEIYVSSVSRTINNCQYRIEIPVWANIRQKDAAISFIASGFSSTSNGFGIGPVVGKKSGGKKKKKEKEKREEKGKKEEKEEKDVKKKVKDYYCYC
jgi:hypothetical protein